MTKEEQYVEWIMKDVEKREKRLQSEIDLEDVTDLLREEIDDYIEQKQFEKGDDDNVSTRKRYRY